jgi:hypothetical protein
VDRMEDLGDAFHGDLEGEWGHYGTAVPNAVTGPLAPGGPDAISSWEGRMAAQAAGRRTAAEAEDYLREKADDPHAGHHTHLDGGSVYCSCGQYLGMTTFAAEDLDDPRARAARESRACTICGKPGVVGLPEPDGR